MTTRFMPATLTAALLVLAPFAASAVTVFTSDFETVAVLAGSPDFQTYSTAAVIDGWTVGDTSVDLIVGGYGAITGYSVDMAGTPGPGSLSRTYNQIAGQTYTLQWDYFQNAPGSPLDVTFNGVTTNYAVTGVIIFGQTLSYVAATNDPAAVVTFRSPSAGNAGATIDNISVSVVPEPEGYGLALAGLAALVGGRKFWRKA
jgi:hypothetical protein